MGDFELSLGLDDGNFRRIRSIAAFRAMREKMGDFKSLSRIKITENGGFQSLCESKEMILCRAIAELKPAAEL